MVFLLDRFFAPKPTISIVSRARLAGKLHRACVELNMPFKGTADGWRTICAPVLFHREVVAGDLGLDEMDDPLEGYDGYQ